MFLPDSKTELRREALLRRDAIPAETRAAAARAIADRPFPIAVRAGDIVSGYLAIRSEIDPLPLMQRLAQLGVRLALPVVSGKGNALVMRAWDGAQSLTSGVWGLQEPPSQAKAVDPDVLLVPLLAFDRSGHRIGYGAGYYDLTLKDLRGRKPVVAIGLAFAAQEIAGVPATNRDEPLDLVLTEREVIDCRGA